MVSVFVSIEVEMTSYRSIKLKNHIMKKSTLFHFILLPFFIFSCTVAKTLRTKQVKWNFKSFKKLTYDYEQVVGMKNPFLDSLPSMKNVAKGKLILKVKSNGKADIILKDMKMVMRDIKQQMPDQFIQDMDEYGKVDGDMNSQQRMLLQMLFPIPTKKIKVNEVSKIPMKIPFSVPGSVINVKGFNSVTLKQINGSSYDLSTGINCTDYTIPDEVEPKYDCFVKGKSQYQFDALAGYFKNGTVEIAMGMGVIAKEGTKEAKKMIVDMKTTIKLKLKKVE